MKYLILTIITFLAPVALSQEIDIKNQQATNQPKISTGNLSDLIAINKVESMSDGEWIRFSFTAVIDIDIAERKRLSEVTALLYASDKTFIGAIANVRFSLSQLPDSKKIHKGDKFIGYIDMGKTSTSAPVVDTIELFTTYAPKKKEGEQAVGGNRR